MHTMNYVLAHLLSSYLGAHCEVIVKRTASKDDEEANKVVSVLFRNSLAN